MSYEKVTAMIEANLVPALEREAKSISQMAAYARKHDDMAVLSAGHLEIVRTLMLHAARRIKAMTPAVPENLSSGWCKNCDGTGLAGGEAWVVCYVCAGTGHIKSEAAKDE